MADRSRQEVSAQTVSAPAPEYCGAETGRRADDGEFEDFSGSVLSTPLPGFRETPGGPEVRYTNRHGRRMAYLWENDMRLMDEPVEPFPADYLFHGPLIESKWGSGIIKIYGDDSTRILDFNTWTVKGIKN